MSRSVTLDPSVRRRSILWPSHQRRLQLGLRNIEVDHHDPVSSRHRAVAYFIIRHFDHAQSHLHGHVSTSGASTADSAAADTLKMRFAKGEIDEDEFSRRMTLLKDHQSVS